VIILMNFNEFFFIFDGEGLRFLSIGFLIVILIIF
jgi:hypothetical protein